MLLALHSYSEDMELKSLDVNIDIIDIEVNCSTALLIYQLTHSVAWQPPVQIETTATVFALYPMPADVLQSVL